MTTTARLLVAAAAAGMLLLAMSGCGKKPSFVDAPEGTVNDTYSKTYPAPVDRSKKTDGLSFP